MHPFRAISAAAAVVCLLLAAVPALAGPREDVEAAMRRFLALKSYQATMQVSAPKPATSQVTFVAPDRYEIRMDGMGTQYILGNRMLLNLGGRRMEVPIPAGTLERYRDPARLHDEREQLDVTDLGPAAVGGRPARKYKLLRRDAPDSVTMLWIAGGLPVQIEARNARGAVSIRYSHFDDASLRVQAP